VNSYAVFDYKSQLKPHKLERRDTEPDDVVIKIIYCGICHSDLHCAHDDWKNASYPVIPGHEIIGEVESVGDKVTKHKVGDIVGVGCLVDSCGNCQYCDMSEEIYCQKGSTQTYNFPERRFPGHRTAGGYSEKIVVPEHFTLSIPKALQTEKLLPGVAPILCAGITTYSPLNRSKIGKGSKVAVCGLGGLGHMGVRIATALGAEVYVVSRSHAKDDKAKALGAKGVISSSSEKEMKDAAGKFDLVLDTIPFDHDVNQYVPLAKIFGELCIVGHVGVFEKSVSSGPLVFGHRRISGSLIGGIKETQELLELCAEKSVISDHELIPMEKVNDAWTSMTSGDVANRFIIDVKQFREQQAQA
ncbi:NAD(P)-dependent alcohol dehydrogenase, partial [Macrococcus caseolyticus]